MDENTIMLIVWLSVLVLSVIVEATTTALVSIWFVFGAIAALCVTYIPGMPFWGEIIIFFGVSLICLLALRPVANKLLVRKKTASNIDEIIGKKGKITKTVTSLENGEVKVNGIYWTAIPAMDIEEIKDGTVVEVVSVSGNKLFVKPVDNQ